MPPEGAVVCTYHYRRLFHDGFPVGGDDLSHDILRDLIFPSVVAQMGLPPAQWNSLFSLRIGGDPFWAVARRNLVTAFWLPVVHGCLRRIEAGKDVDATLGELPAVRNEGAVRGLNERLKKLQAARKDLPADALKSVLDVRIRFTQDDLLRVTRRTLGTALRQYCDIIGQFRPDVLVLGGRPSSLPSVGHLIRESLPLPPGALVFLHDQLVDEWFPFTENGRIGDSKTCSVVGAAVAFMARHDYSNFVLRLDPDAQPVMNIQGVLSVGEMVLRSKPTLFPADELVSNPVRFEGEAITMGCRHINGDNAMARPTYRLLRDPLIEECIRTNPVHNDPLAGASFARERGK